MKRRKNLERAVVLGLLLSTSVYGSVWAESITDSQQINTNETLIIDGINIYDKLNNIAVTVDVNGDENSLNVNSNGNAIAIDYSNTVTPPPETKMNIILNSDGDVNLNSKNEGIYLNWYNNNGFGNDPEAFLIDINADGNFNISSQIQPVSSGIHVNTYGGTVDIDAQKGINIIVKGDSLFRNSNSGHIQLDAKENIIFNINSSSNANMGGYIYNGNTNFVSVGNNVVGIDGIRASDIVVKTEKDIDFIGHETSASNGMNAAVFSIGRRKFMKPSNNNLPDKLVDEEGYLVSDTNKTLLNANNIDIQIINDYGEAYGAVALCSDKVFIDFKSQQNNNLTVESINNNSIALNTMDGNISFNSATGNNTIKAIAEKDGYMGIGILTDTYLPWYLNHNRVTLTAEQNNTIIASTIAVDNNGSDSIVKFKSNSGNNYLRALDSNVIDSEDESDTLLVAIDGKNILKAGNINNNFGDTYAINALTGSSVDLQAGAQNIVCGAIFADGDETAVSVSGVKGDSTTRKIDDSADNYFYSSAVVEGAGGIADKNIISALYTQNKGNIDIDGNYNYISSSYVDNGVNILSDSENNNYERVVWAYEKIGDDNTSDKSSVINIDGTTVIRAAHAVIDDKTGANDESIAVAAGTATDLTAEKVAGFDGKRATVNINYGGETFDKDGKSVTSAIVGDVLAAYAGEVNINPQAAKTKAAGNAGINIYGNLLAGNNGILNVNLGQGGVLTGRADDYGDAKGHTTFYNPEFSSEIFQGGKVNLTMGDNARWNVQGQSWITSIDTSNAENTEINLVEANTDFNTTAHALTIGTLTGNTDFHMSLDADRNVSDMLYIKNANGDYQVTLEEAVTREDMYADGFDGLRFATVGEGSNVSFVVGSYDDGGAFNVEYEVDTDSYAGNEENTAYNSTSTDGSANVEKPGNASVDDFFGLTNSASTQEAAPAAANGIMLIAENEEAADTAANADTGLEEVTNFKLVARLSEELNDTGETILNMSRANYSNAIYMDRLNKRLGEARYINGEEEDGMWVRIRHDRIGKTDAYRSQNTMYELGYDKKQDCDNGERRVGFAVDYMHGDTGYSDIAGKGEIDRYGLWLYDTWMGDKGHYVDYVAKWGHLSNDFEVYTMRDGDKVTGDYSNNVFSVSAEYGRKKDIGNDWYFEPQAQLQLARVTGADYTTNQGTKVSVDGINSLIGRAGFRIGKDFGEEKQSTLYFKADVLHEFLGDQDVYVMDKSTDNKWAGISYDNEGTWYDIGIGYAAMMSKSSYAFIDLEQSFGNDNDDTYQINAGVRWTF